MARTDRSVVVDSGQVVITERQWGLLAPFVAKKGARLEVAFLGSLTGMTYSTARALIISLHRDGVADLYRLVYHGCTEPPIERRRAEDGLQTFPWTCSECEEEVVYSADVRHEFQAVLRRSIEKSDLNVVG